MYIKYKFYLPFFHKHTIIILFILGISEHNEDKTFVPSDDEITFSDISSTSEKCQPKEEYEVVFVYYTELMKLLRRCMKCGELLTSTNVLLNQGSQFAVTMECFRGCKYRWSSQPELKPLRGQGNLDLTCAITFAGWYKV